MDRHWVSTELDMQQGGPAVTGTGEVLRWSHTKVVPTSTSVLAMPAAFPACAWRQLGFVCCSQEDLTCTWDQKLVLGYWCWTFSASALLSHIYRISIQLSLWLVLPGCSKGEYQSQQSDVKQEECLQLVSDCPVGTDWQMGQERSDPCVWAALPYGSKWDLIPGTGNLQKVSESKLHP